MTCNWGDGKHNDEVDPSATLGGAFAEYMLVPGYKVAKAPQTLSFETSAALTLVGLTAFQGLFDKLKVSKGQKVLILGGAGAVGSIACQLAKGAGCWVCCTASSRNTAYVSQFGVDKIVDYTSANWWEDGDLKDIDAIFDAIGEKEVFQHSCANGIVREGGSFVSIVSALADFSEEDAAKYSSVTNFVLRHSAEQLEILGAMVASGALKVIVEDTFEFTPEASLHCTRNRLPESHKERVS